MFKAFDERRAQKSEASYGAFADQSQDVTSEFVVKMRCVEGTRVENTCTLKCVSHESAFDLAVYR
jgi:hypothetical protein